MADFELPDSPNLISRKIEVAEKARCDYFFQNHALTQMIFQIFLFLEILLTIATFVNTGSMVVIDMTFQNLQSDVASVTIGTSIDH